VVWAIYSWTNHGSKKYGPDGSVLISTFITLYGLFFGGFGVLAGFVRKAPYIRLRVIAILFMVEATIVDLFRVVNSTEDFYNTTIRKLTFFQLHDDMHDFLVYFFLNLGVSAFVLMVACLPTSAARPAATPAAAISDDSVGSRSTEPRGSPA